MTKNIISLAGLFLVLAIFLYFSRTAEEATSVEVFTQAKDTQHLRPKNMQGEIHNVALLRKQLEKPVTYPENLDLTLNQYQADAVYPGKILMSVHKTNQVYLLNHQLEILNSWPVDAERARLLPNCNLGVVFGTRSGRSELPWKEIQGVFAELDWAGNLVWEYRAPDILHHDFQLLNDDSFLFLIHDFLDQSVRPVKFRKPDFWEGITSDSVIQVNRLGQITKRWDAAKNLDLNSCGSNPVCELAHQVKLEPGKRKRNHDWSHTNTISVLPENKWYQAGHQEFKPGNLLVLPRNFWEAIIIDQETGKPVWRYSGTADDPLVYGHEALMIEEGLPGAGNILVFDNGNSERAYSIIREINPTNKEIVWSYQDKNNFYAPTGGLAQRLPNGNTFISADNGGRVFEVTAEKEVVWDVQSSNRIYRAQKYSDEYCEKLNRL